MWDEKSVYPKTERIHAFLPDMNDESVEKFKGQPFTQGSATLKALYYNPSDKRVQRLPVREKVEETEINRKRSG